MEARRYAFFDVDGTVIERDSFMRIAFHVARHEPWRLVPALLAVPLFLVTKWLNLDRRYAKSLLLWCATVGRGKRGAVRFFRNELLPILVNDWRPEVDAELRALRAEGNAICYVSASGQLWLRLLLNRCDPLPKRIIGSRLGFRWGGVVVVSPNCYREEKIRRIHEALGRDIEWVAGYSDHPADLPLLKACRRRFVISPREKHLKVFHAELGDTYRIFAWKAQRTLPITQ